MSILSYLIIGVITGILGLIGIKIAAKGCEEIIKYDTEPVLCQMTNIQGKLVGIKADRTGLSRVTVRDNKGRLLYGFSSLSVKQLESIYKEDDWVKIPLVTPPAGRAYKIE